MRVQTQVKTNPFKTAVFTLLSVAFFALVLWLNYLTALRWVGVINAESTGYMVGGVIFSSLVGFLAVYALRARGRQIAPASRALGITGIAVLLSILGLAEDGKIDADIHRHLSVLLKEAAGKQPAGGDSNSIDAAIRDYFRDVLELNQHYAAEAAAVDLSATRNLYSTDSYAGVTHMRKVVGQLKAALAVDEKYASIDPLIKRMEDRVAAANASEEEKRDFLDGAHSALPQALAARNEVIHKEEGWTKSAIALYEFLIAHNDEYFMRDSKIYFQNSATRKEFTAQQANSIKLHKEFLSARKAMLKARSKGAYPPLDFSPAQLGKQK